MQNRRSSTTIMYYIVHTYTNITRLIVFDIYVLWFCECFCYFQVCCGGWRAVPANQASFAMNTDSLGTRQGKKKKVNIDLLPRSKLPCPENQTHNSAWRGVELVEKKRIIIIQILYTS